MNSTTTFIQRIVAGLSTRVRATLAPAPVLTVSPAYAGAHSAVGMSFHHVNNAWRSDVAETGCVSTTYVTKRITTGRPFEVST